MGDTNSNIDLDTLSNLSRQDLVELANLTSQWATNKDHKFYLYRANPIMQAYHDSQAKIRVLLGGNRSGKTYALCMELAAQFLGESPGNINILKHRLDSKRKNRLCTIDYPNNFIKVIWPYLTKFIPSDRVCDVIKDQGRVKSITNFHGGFLEFMQYEQAVTKMQGSARHCIGYDEEPPLAIRDENMMRLVDYNGEEMFSLTPVSEIDRPVLWIADALYYKAGRVVEKTIDGITDITNPLGDSNIHCFFANIYDNIAIDKEAADRILSLYPDEERAVRERGHFMFLSGRIYKNFTDAHLIQPFEWWKQDMTLFISIDTHPRTNTAVLFMAVDRYGTKYLVDEMFEPLNDLDKFISIFKAKCHNVTPELQIIEPAAFIPDPVTGQCLAHTLMDRGLGIVRSAPKDLSNGIIKTNDEFRLVDGKSKIYVFQNLTRFRYEITHYVWGSWKKETAVTKEQKQKPIDKDDHLMECLYRLVLLNPTHTAQQIYEEDYSYKQKRRTGGMYEAGY